MFDSPAIPDRLVKVLKQHQAISVALDAVAAENVGRPRQYSKLLARYFADGPDPMDVIRRPDALAICLPLLPSSDQAPEAWQIEDGVNQGLDQLTVFEPPRKRLLLQIGYPLLVFLMAIVLVTAYLLFLVPVFDDMFQEFGLRLAPATQAVVQASRMLRSYGIFVVGFLAACAAIFVIILFLPKQTTGPVWSGRLRMLLTSTSDALSVWAWHVAMLIEFGFPLADAIIAAGSATNKSWLLQKSTQWAGESRAGDAPMQNDSIVDRRGCHLLSYAVGADLPEGKTILRPDLLREVALVFRDKSQYQWSSVLAWLSPCLMMLVSLSIGFFVVALMSPLISLIGGLT
jgi:type II secretory pathway component PulF